MKLANNAELIPSMNRLYDEVILFVHHFGGSKMTSVRQQNYFNELGFDCVAFDMTHQTPANTPRSAETVRSMLRGLRHLWADQIESVLSSIDRPVIMYSFSMPGGAALEAMSRRRFSHLAAWIADCGPFMSVPMCYWNYMNRFHAKWSLPLKALGVLGSYAAMGIYDYKKDVRAYFEVMPEGFPILSIRSWDDELVPISAIDEFFSLGEGLNLEILSIPEADHLQGLAKSPDDYKPRVSKFIRRVASETEQPIAKKL